MEAIKPKRSIMTADRIERSAARKAGNAKAYREHRKTLTKEQKEEEAQNRRFRKEDRESAKKEKAYVKQCREYAKRELAILEYMNKVGVIYYHHSEEDMSYMKKVASQIAEIKDCLRKPKEGEENSRYRQPKQWHSEYDSYIWNRQGEGNNYMWRSLMHNIWRSSEFETIHDVPLDGTYVFAIYDSGERGCGSYNRITANKVNEPVNVPKVSPGSLFPVTAF